ncbi:Uncharacterised protein [Salmonella enterica subsp. indica]|uniref:Uncharacterized protein n=1 Tax=Salmonella enterica subsp. indica TaxID=59207 RepID=A0A379YQM7_SALER|nr:hypothetical protein [Salmonella enterica]ECF5888636.1 hypothetical protein [Salmonella enterica subsp. indica]SUI48915.1 Uncharacterised protein [Salmonella enterica subsp. indica]HAE2755398.1 hypothetical protein [Salmonella enterica subsp. indica]HBC0171721.1 hypothetical protein [Salmonella enterica subsp. indica]HBZ5824471.1 hypothetical protein [Salmonella enterica]
MEQDERSSKDGAYAVWESDEGPFTVSGVDIDTLIKRTFRFAHDRFCVGEIKGGCPAFSFWAEKLNSGEKLPRGKYFRRIEMYNSMMKINTCVFNPIDSNK